MMSQVDGSTLGFSRRRFLSGMAVLVAAGAMPAAQAFENPLSTAATRSDLLSRSPLLAVAYTGTRIVAAGMRGSIVISDDQGKNWVQANVPVSTDLVAISFPSKDHGWAVGHGGVVLHSADGGANWQKQLDGVEASRLAIAYYEQQATTAPELEAFVEREKMFAVEGETQPFLSVHFVNDQQGYVVGTFNRIFSTADGGRSWQPLMHLTDNAGELHFYSVTGSGSSLFIAGEQGKVWTCDIHLHTFSHLDTPYDGTLFGLLAEPDSVFAYGMRGNLFRKSSDSSAWEKVDSTAQAGITGAITMPDSGLLLVDQAGVISRSDNDGKSFTAVTASNPMPYFAVALLPDQQIVLVGAAGVRIESV